MNEVCEFLKKCGTYYLATVDGDKPQLRPFGTAHLFDGKLYIQTGKKKAVSAQLAKNPNIALCAFDGKVWLRVTATAIEDNRREAKVSMLNDYPDLKKMYSPDDANTEVLYLKNATATFTSFTTAPRTVKF